MVDQQSGTGARRARLPADLEGRQHSTADEVAGRRDRRVAGPEFAEQRRVRGARAGDAFAEESGGRGRRKQRAAGAGLPARAIAAVQVDKQAMLEMLAQWIDRKNTDFLLAAPVWSDQALQPEQRPEYRLFALQQSAWQIQKDRLKLFSQPRIEAFAQAGYGQPNPMNFFETGFEPFAIFGLRASWTPIDWGNRKRDAEVYELQMKNVEVQRDAFRQRLEAGTIRDFWDLNVKYKEQLTQDAAIVALQDDIVRRADAQVQNGVMTTTDYLSQVDLLTQARLNRKTHLIQAVQAQEMSKVRK